MQALNGNSEAGFSEGPFNNDGMSSPYEAADHLEEFENLAANGEQAGEGLPRSRGPVEAWYERNQQTIQEKSASEEVRRQSLLEEGENKLHEFYRERDRRIQPRKAQHRDGNRLTQELRRQAAAAGVNPWAAVCSLVNDMQHRSERTDMGRFRQVISSMRARTEGSRA